MANIVNKIGETLGVGGGQKIGDQHPVDQHKNAAGGGIIDKVKNQIPGGSSETQTHQAGGYKEGGHAGGGGGGIIDKVKNQIPGGSSATQTHQAGDYKEGGHAGGGGIIDQVKNQIQGGHK